MDMREMVEKVKKGEPLYGESTLSPYMQGVAARNSRYSQIMLHVIPWFNFVNHNQVSSICREVQFLVEFNKLTLGTLSFSFFFFSSSFKKCSTVLIHPNTIRLLKMSLRRNDWRRLRKNAIGSFIPCD